MAIPSLILTNRTSVSRALEFFVCPSNRKADAAGAGGSNVSKVGPSDYRGNMAAGLQPGCTNPNDINCGIFDNGITFRNSTVSIADITDGTSFTVYMGETLEGTWPDATSCCVRTVPNRTINKPIIIQVSGNTKTYWTYWSSKHNGVVNFAKCDGSVSSLNAQINKVVLQKLMTRNGGEALTSNELK